MDDSPDGKGTGEHKQILASRPHMAVLFIDQYTTEIFQSVDIGT